MPPESESTFPPPFESENPERFESQYGDENAILEIMEHGDVTIIGNIDDLFEDIPPHANEVDMVDIAVGHSHINSILGLRIQRGDRQIKCIFKPLDGESKSTKEEWDIEEPFYIHERTAYLISKHFGFDVVPPTTVREINGRIGAVQLFLDHHFHEHVHEASEKDFERIIHSNCAARIALLDWMIACPERHGYNWLYDRNNPTRVTAIDHGITLMTKIYDDTELRGPSLAFTYDNAKKRPKNIPISLELIGLLEDGQERATELTRELIEAFGDTEVSRREVEMFWGRVRDTLKYRVFLSKANYRSITGAQFISTLLRRT